MLKAKKKITKREIKEDKLVTTYFEAQAFIERNRKMLSSIGVGVLIVAVVGWVYFNNVREARTDATTDLGKVMQYYDQGHYQVAIDGVPQENVRGLKTIVESYGSTPSGEYAKLYLGNAYYVLGKYDEALAAYLDVDLSDDTFSAAALAGAAACYEAKGEFARAAQYFERAYRQDGRNVLSPGYLYDTADCFLRAGERGKAREYVEQLKKEFPNSPEARQSDRLLGAAES